MLVGGDERASQRKMGVLSQPAEHAAAADGLMSSSPNAGATNSREGKPFMRVGRVKPPAPKATPAEIRMAKLSEALCALCVTFEELALEQQQEEQLRHRVMVEVPSRLEAVQTEVAQLLSRREARTRGRRSSFSGGANAAVASSATKRACATAATMDPLAAALNDAARAETAASEEYAAESRLRELQEERIRLDAELRAHESVIEDANQTRSPGEEARWAERWNAEAVIYLRSMLSCAARAVRLRAALSLAVLAGSTDDCKQIITKHGPTKRQDVEVRCMGGTGDHDRAQPSCPVPIAIHMCVRQADAR